VFVCRSTGCFPRALLAATPEMLSDLIARDADSLRQAGVDPSPGDLKCMTFGHLVRLAVWSLRSQWDPDAPTDTKVARVTDWLAAFGRTPSLDHLLRQVIQAAKITSPTVPQETAGADPDEISF
jgi:putative DNA methylase